MLQVLIDISLKVLLQKRDMGYAKVIQKKKIKEKKSLEKMYKCSRYLKQWVLRCPPKKMNKIAPVL
jgi:transcription elongation factor Elf1